MSKIDDLLNIGAAFDWITPTVAFVNDWRYGPAAHLGAPALCGFDRGDIRRCLNQGGVRVWGLMYDLSGDLIMFAVNQAQEDLTLALLNEAGIPVW